MAHGLLEVLRYFLLALVWLFIAYCLRTTFVEFRRARARLPEVRAGAGDPLERSAAPRAALRLRVVEPAQRRGSTVEVGNEVTLGRSPTCAVSLDGDTFASSLHARVFPRDGEVWVEDLGSTNGTYVNEERLAGPARLRRGDRLRVGETVLEVAR